MSKIEIRMGKETESVINYILSDFNDEQLDQIDVEREYADNEGLASEPVTTVVVLTLSTTAIIAVARSIEKWIELERQRVNIEGLLIATGISDEATKAMQKLNSLHAKVAVQTVPEIKKP
jgi:hypothetical protein